MTFNAWFASLSAALKILFILGIVALCFVMGMSFVSSGARIWKLITDRRAGRKKRGNLRDEN